MAESSAEPEPETEPEPEVEPESYANGTSESEPNALPEDSILSDHETAVWTLLYLLLIASTLLMNALIVRAMTKRLSGKRESEGNCIKKPSDMFLLSLIIARMNVAGFVMPSRIMGMFSSEGIGQVICKLCAFAGTGSAATSVFCTCAVGISKVIELKWKEVPSRKPVIKTIALLWVIGHAYALREPFLNDIVERENSKGEIIFICGEIPKYRTMTAVFIMCDILLLFVIPTVIVICASIAFIKHSSKSSPNGMIKNNNTHVNANTQIPEKIPKSAWTENGSVDVLKDRNVSFQAPKSADTRYMAVIILCLFIFCYAAAYTWKAMIFTDSISHLKMETALTIEQALYLWTFLNPLLNAATYLYFRLDIRVRFKSIFKKTGS